MKVLNFGSLNVDYVYSMDHILLPGETECSAVRNVFAGGKGLNQSVALAKAGLETYHAGQIGADADGQMLVDMLRENGVHTEFVRAVNEPGGHTVIQVDKNGQNSILLFGGANRTIPKSYRRTVLEHFAPGDVIVLQNEVNDLHELIDEAWERGLRVVLNPSPYDGAVEKCELSHVSLFFINEIEGAQISGNTAPDEILAWFAAHFPAAVVVLTLGGEGSCCLADGKIYRQDIVPVSAVDTTAAGDTFTGYFLRQYLENGDIKAAMALAAGASAIAVSRAGAARSIPRYEEVVKQQ